jgi:hypothetical protein
LIAAKEALNPYKKRKDFDYLKAVSTFEKIIKENDKKKFDELQCDIYSITGVLD